jgi:hypothetical protein
MDFDNELAAAYLHVSGDVGERLENSLKVVDVHGKLRSQGVLDIVRPNALAICGRGRVAVLCMDMNNLYACQQGRANGRPEIIIGGHDAQFGSPRGSVVDQVCAEHGVDEFLLISVQEVLWPNGASLFRAFPLVYEMGK